MISRSEVVAAGDRREALPHPALPRRPQGRLGQRVKDMTLLWVLFGVVVGGCTEPARQGTISGVIAGILAGVIVLSSLGLILGLLGGQVKTSLVGGLLGGGLVFLLGFFGTKVNPFLLGSFGLILGGLAGGTIGILFWWIRCVKHLVMRATQGRRPSGQANQPWFSSLGREAPAQK